MGDGIDVYVNVNYGRPALGTALANHGHIRRACSCLDNFWCMKPLSRTAEVQSATCHQPEFRVNLYIQVQRGE